MVCAKLSANCLAYLTWSETRVDDNMLIHRKNFPDPFPLSVVILSHLKMILPWCDEYEKEFLNPKNCWRISLRFSVAK